MEKQNMRNYINGKWIEPEESRFMDVENPSTGAVIGRAPVSSGKDIASAVDAATQASQRRIRRDNAVQFSRHGTVLVYTVRNRHRQYIYP